LRLSSFSDELYSPENPYTLSQQIKMGRFDYPSPYWDSVGDPALDLIDRMLTVDVDKRMTVDECLEHPWVTQRYLNPADSTDGLTGAMDQLDFSKRKLERERTLLSSINDVKVSKVIDTQDDKIPVKVFEKNSTGKRVHNNPAKNGISVKSKTAATKRRIRPQRRGLQTNSWRWGKGRSAIVRKRHG
jgi:serine/threonine-protein kinase Chk2